MREAEILDFSLPEYWDSHGLDDQCPASPAIWPDLPIPASIVASDSLRNLISSPASIIVVAFEPGSIFEPNSFPIGTVIRREEDQADLKPTPAHKFNNHWGVVVGEVSESGPGHIVALYPDDPEIERIQQSGFYPMRGSGIPIGRVFHHRTVNIESLTRIRRLDVYRPVKLTRARFSLHIPVNPLRNNASP